MEPNDTEKGVDVGGSSKSNLEEKLVDDIGNGDARGEESSLVQQPSLAIMDSIALVMDSQTIQRVADIETEPLGEQAGELQIDKWVHVDEGQLSVEAIYRRIMGCLLKKNLRVWRIFVWKGHICQTQSLIFHRRSFLKRQII